MVAAMTCLRNSDQRTFCYTFSFYISLNSGVDVIFNCTFGKAMKKIIALLLAVLYIGTTSGVVLNVHYCMGKISSVKVDNFRNTFCKCGKKEAGGHCCKTEIRVAKFSNDHQASVASFDVKAAAVILPWQISLIDLCETSANIPVPADANAPPGISSKIYIENCVFRI